jgi:membrane-associated PAP2 superfamily phosphatase
LLFIAVNSLPEEDAWRLGVLEILTILYARWLIVLLKILNSYMLNKQIIITLIAIVLCLLFFDFSSIDLLVQDFFFDVQFKHWMIDRNNQVLKFIFYDGIKILYVLFLLGLLVTLIVFRKAALIKAYRQGLLIVLLSVILVPLIIGSLKAITNVPCPKNIQHFGGDYPYVTIFSKYPESFHQTENIKCFPAGHASGAFALMALFFLFKTKRNRQIALAASITLGWVTGSYKMFIGDHFLSHTLMSMLLAWLIILVVVKTIYSFRKEPGQTLESP